MPANFLKNYLKELKALCDSVDPFEFAEFAHELKRAYDAQVQIFICGNGGSASSASHFVCDMNKGVSYGREKRFKVICLNDNIPVMLAYTNDVSFEDVFAEQLKNSLTSDDLVIGVSGSGNSKNILKAIEYANQKGARTFGICGFGGGKLKTKAMKSLAIKSTDMQKIEDLHLIVFHCIMQYFAVQ